MLNNNCPCGSNKTFANCCNVYHQGLQPAPTAEALMRSRYSAYVIHNIDYIIKTTWPSHQAALKNERALLQQDKTHWLRLDIINSKKGGPNDISGSVEFKAWYKDTIEDQEKALHEASDFTKRNGLWFYIHPTISQTTSKSTIQVGRNEPCPCGSGKKHKKCCIN